MRWFVALCAAIAFSAIPAFAADPVKPTAGQLEFLKRKCAPLLAEKLLRVSRRKKRNGRVTARYFRRTEGGADNGPVLVPGDPPKPPHSIGEAQAITRCRRRRAARRSG